MGIFIVFILIMLSTHVLFPYPTIAYFCSKKGQEEKFAYSGLIAHIILLTIGMGITVMVTSDLLFIIPNACLWVANLYLIFKPKKGSYILAMRTLIILNTLLVFGNFFWVGQVFNLRVFG